jgi:hypothetical protein
LSSAVKKVASAIFDAGIFYVPIFFAIITALIAWYVPIPQKEARAQLGVTLPDGQQQS